ncbi:hypothetical protein [Thermosipho sp. (in: thermotogales)]|nr:hypothetical protein [Thermosipho sp. (in: thermotogales)]MBZ4649164.1 hypothetical protein [Thermosipho sp. (in: thermotogales)]
MMPAWEKNIFVRVIQYRVAEEGRTVEEILAEYPTLTQDEKDEIKKQ